MLCAADISAAGTSAALKQTKAESFLALVRSGSVSDVKSAIDANQKTDIVNSGATFDDSPLIVAIRTRGVVPAAATATTAAAAAATSDGDTKLLFELLLARGARFDAEEFAHSALAEAVLCCNPPAVSALIAGGATDYYITDERSALSPGTCIEYAYAMRRAAEMEAEAKAATATATATATAFAVSAVVSPSLMAWRDIFSSLYALAGRCEWSVEVKELGVNGSGHVPDRNRVKQERQIPY